MKKFLISLIIYFIISIHFAYPNKQIEISLLTCSSGEESFTTWGHSALRVIDKNKSSDIVYNFGLFDFGTPNFHLKFIKGNLKYKLGAHDTYRFIQSYISEDRQVIEQKLNLSDESKTKIINRLEYLYKPENKYYYYDFLKKNCTSELRDLIFNNIKSDFKNKITEKSFRNQLDEYMLNKPWLKFGINLVFGVGVDRKVNRYESMFLPDYLCEGIDNIKINDKKLVSSKTIFNKIENRKSDYSFLLSPIFLFSILLIIVLIFKTSKIQFPILLIIGLTGLFILSVVIITEHPELKNNFNLLWCNPLYLVLVFFQINKNIKYQLYLAIILQAMILGFIVIWISRIQSFEIGFLLIAMILSIYNIRTIKKGTNPSYIYKK